MLTEEKIKTITSFDVPLLKEALRQAELRLKDARDRQTILDKKCLFMFIFYSLMSFFSIGAFLNLGIKVPTIEFIFCFLIVLPFLVCSKLLLFALKGRTYGTLGRYPDTWLQEEIINGEDDSQYGYVLANILFDYQDAIACSDKSNESKIKLFDAALYFGMVSVWGVVITFYLIV